MCLTIISILYIKREHNVLIRQWNYKIIIHSSKIAIKINVNIEIWTCNLHIKQIIYYHLTKTTQYYYLVLKSIHMLEINVHDPQVLNVIPDLVNKSLYYIKVKLLNLVITLILIKKKIILPLLLI